MKAIVWSNVGCSYCEQAKKLLDSKDYYIQNLKSPKVSFGSDKAPTKLVISYLPSEEAYEVSLENYIKVEKK